MARKDPEQDPLHENLHRDNVPGSLDHASGEVDEFEAALVAGSEGEEQVVSDEDLTRQAEAAGGGAGGGRGRGSAVATSADPAGAPARRGPGRFLAFLRASWAELQRVQWPNRRQVGQATAVVLGFVVIAGAYLGLADGLAQELVDLIL